ncbi:hypothetical protein E1091_06535 [Micromonospora fluostatini]|uniref:Uncharacterized protein n=1 Tax=Micromonospora fluostatini TaxID=1629071 RepID=A0ABY2DIR9_9ACTN|nr:hypothetical protein E1091_06535 [Micromonospora fluostatini]
MTVSLPTYDFCGMLKDVSEFAPSARDAKNQAYVRIGWDGSALRISTFAEIHAAIATYAFPESLRSGDGPWEVLLRTTQAKFMAKFFELKGVKGAIPISLYTRQGRLDISRRANEEHGVDAQQQLCGGDVDVLIKRVEAEFADLGARTDVPVRIGPVAHMALSKAAKRTGECVTSVPHARGIRSTVGAELVVYSRWPLEVDHAEVDAQAMADAAVAEL